MSGREYVAPHGSEPVRPDDYPEHGVPAPEPVPNVPDPDPEPAPEPSSD